MTLKLIQTVPDTVKSNDYILSSTDEYVPHYLF